jgi:hypothetical protein
MRLGPAVFRSAGLGRSAFHRPPCPSDSSGSASTSDWGSGSGSTVAPWQYRGPKRCEWPRGPRLSVGPHQPSHCIGHWTAAIRSGLCATGSCPGQCEHNGPPGGGGVHGSACCLVLNRIGWGWLPASSGQLRWRKRYSKAPSRLAGDLIRQWRGGGGTAWQLGKPQ